MPLSIALLNLQMLLRKIGRGVVTFAHDGDENPVRWDPGQPFHLSPLGDTEGDITVEPNGAVANLTLPEISGEAVYDATYTGENPVLNFPLFLADPTLLPIVSPIGSQHAGLERVQDVAERTIVVFPERIFKRPNVAGYGTLSYSAAQGWRLDGAALTPAQETLLGHAIFFWRGYFTRPGSTFRGGHGNDAKNLEPTSFQSMMHPDLLDGHHLYTRGDPTPFGIDLGVLS